MNQRVIKVEVALNKLEVTENQELTQGDKNTHFINLKFDETTDLRDAQLQVIFKLPFPEKVPLVDTYTKLQQEMNILISNDALLRSGELTIEFALKKNNQLITVNKNLTLKVRATINATYVEEIQLGDTTKQTIAEQLEKLITLLAQAQEQVDKYNDNVTEKTNEFNNNYNEKLKSFNQNDTQKTSVFNSNADQKVEEYNKNSDKKKSEFDKNVTQKITEFDNHVNDSKKDIDSYKDNVIKHEIDIYVGTTSKKDIDQYVETVSKVNIDNYVIAKEEKIKGATYTPAVDEAGNLSFTNDKGLANPDPVNLIGPKGENGKDLTVEVQGTIGMKFDEKLRFLNDVGVKKKGFCYFDKLTNRVFECLNDTDSTVNDIRYFKDISNKHNIDYIAGLFENTKLYDINSNPINDNFFKGKVTKIIGVKIDVEANDFLNSENKLIKFNYKKVMNQCCYANIICTRPTKSHLVSSLENKVFARIQNIDSVEITIGVLNNNKKEKIEIFLVLYGD